MEYDSSIWDAPPVVPPDANEARVEQLVVEPLLKALGYTPVDIARLHPLSNARTDSERKPGRHPEADFAVYNGPSRETENCLFVVEAKRPGISLSKAAAQAEYYAFHLKALIYVVTDGLKLEIWQFQFATRSVLMVRTNIRALPEARAGIERALGRNAILDYKAKLEFPDAREEYVELSPYESAESERMLKNPTTIPRVVSFRETRAFQPNDMSVDGLLNPDGRSAIILARSGMGKTRVCSRLMDLALTQRISKKSRRLPIEVPLPELVASGDSLLEFAFKRVNAQARAITLSILKEKIASLHGIDFFCDAFDRVAPEYRMRVEFYVSSTLRDYPRCRVFLFSRTSVVPNLELDTYFLRPLSPLEQQMLEEAIVGTKIARQNRLFHPSTALPRIIQGLCDSPLILSWVVNFFRAEKRLPDNLAEIFNFWLDRILRPNERVKTQHFALVSALKEIAVETNLAPVDGHLLAQHLKMKDLSPEVLDELHRLDAITVSGNSVEVTHEALADFLRARAIIDEPPDQRVERLAQQPFDKDGFFPVVFAAMANELALQRHLFDRVVPVGFSAYMEAIRYKAKIHKDQTCPPDIENIRNIFLEELLDGFVGTAETFFPNIVTRLIEFETGAPENTVEVTSGILQDGETLAFSLESRVGFQRTARPVRHFLMNRDAPDRARVVGLGILRLWLRHIIAGAHMSGGAVWHEERLLSRLRLLMHRGAVCPTSFDIAVQRQFWEGQTGLVIPAEDHYPALPVNELLEDIAILEEAEIERLTPWWTQATGDEAWSSEWDRSDETIKKYHLRLDAAYREIVEQSFPEIAGDLETYGVLPRSWSIILKDSGNRLTLKPLWSPVKSWSDVRAEITKDDVDGVQWAQQTGALLSLYGRRVGRLAITYKLAPMFNGYPISGKYDGKTAVLRGVSVLLQNELKKFFDGVATEMPAD
ncbi:type I restriction enzyme HsdR N-terminal domain-containing protein [Paraburkholderia caribensis]|uniref:type I restriction enzyme HsdR N-terminal domain-containing protein n=1 Tax=Paraburkholderia caribensis TaxID=75105 RepID=UPI001CB454C6|nr:type I restriction enzyme HsdR N-terminal domain-containing protein [Paraburkholderia caribensis]CAG9250779.1 putative Type I restriction enzyme R protein N terminus (HSDR_N) [Paraburkholderia caribensis]